MSHGFVYLGGKPSQGLCCEQKVFQFFQIFFCWPFQTRKLCKNSSSFLSKPWPVPQYFIKKRSIWKPVTILWKICQKGLNLSSHTEASKKKLNELFVEQNVRIILLDFYDFHPEFLTSTQHNFSAGKKGCFSPGREYFLTCPTTVADLKTSFFCLSLLS